MSQTSSPAAGEIPVHPSALTVGLVACVLTLSRTVAAAGNLTLASGGETAYKIRLCENPTLAEKTAASELQKYLQQITGVSLPIQEAGPLSANAILVGRPKGSKNKDPGFPR